MGVIARIYGSGTKSSLLVDHCHGIAMFMTRRSELNFPAIYTITHKASGKTYVGQTTNVRIRWMMHRSDLKKGKHRNSYLQYAWNKHGANAFEFAVVRDMRDVHASDLADALNKSEIETLKAVEQPYNLMEAGISGMVAGPETRAIWSEQRLALWKDPEFRAKHARSMRVLYDDPEWKAARDASVKEAKGSDQNRAAVSAHMSTLWQTKHHRETQSAKRKANWEDPAYRAQQSASRAASWADPEIRERRMAGLLTAAANPDILAARKEGQKKSLHKMAAATKSRWADPEWRANTIALQNAGRAKRKASA
jgi:group I intron endonuclease